MPASTVNSPPSTESSARSPDTQHRVVRKRNRIPLSCGPCRNRKLKCNRSHPCDNCLKRGDTQSCTYAQSGQRRRGGASDTPGSPDEMQDRINRLESLVLSLMTNGSPSSGPAAAAAALGARQNSITSSDSPSTTGEAQKADEDSEVEQMSRDIGVMKVQNDRQFFASDAHWFAILSDIAEVKNYFADHKKQYEEQMERVKASRNAEQAIGTSLLFKGADKMDKSEILSAFPPRLVANQLITRYFETENPATHIIHRPTFVKQWEKYWQNPSSASIAWIGMCNAMMCLSLQSYHRAGDEPQEYRDKSWTTSLQYLDMTTNCLVTADWTQPMNFMIETLCLYLQAEHARSRDAETGIWILVSIIIKLGMRMGLHRDSRPYLSLSAFQGEMRRRLWNFIRSYDVLLSFQIGMPVTIKSCDCDTSLPTNIFDEEFGEETPKLPQSRPLSESTPMSFMIINCNFTFILGRVIEGCNALTPFSYEDAMKLDGELRQIRENVPPNLVLKTGHDSLDSPSLIMQRFTLDLLYHKSMLTLHRKFLIRAREHPRFAYSRQAAVESCMEMLKHQVTINTECQPGGRLQSVPWSVTSSITIHDFLLAGMIVCLDLYHTAGAESKGQTQDANYSFSLEHRDEMFQAIEKALNIWDSMRDTSMEAFKAAMVLHVMLIKLRNHQALREQMSSNFSFNSSSNGVSLDGHVAPEHSAAMTLGMMASGGLGQEGMGAGVPPRTGFTPQPGSSSDQQSSGASTANMGSMADQMNFSNLFGSTTGFQGLDIGQPNLDWDAWDTYVQGQGIDGAAGMNLDPLLDGNSPSNQFQTPTGQGDGKTMANPPIPPFSGMYQPPYGAPQA